MTDIEQRFTDLENRIAALETLNREQKPIPVIPANVQKLIEIEIKNKRYDPKNVALHKFEDHIWFDCYYTLSESSKSTRAVKGLLEFADLFGEVKFMLNTTINIALEAGKTTFQPSVGFNYNQFLAAHQWMLGTDLKDMTIQYKVLNVIYSDGLSESFQPNADSTA